MNEMRKLMESLDRINESYTGLLKSDLIGYPNLTFSQQQAVKIPKGTEVKIAPGGDLYKPGLESEYQILKIIANNEIYFVNADSYYNATSKG